MFDDNSRASLRFVWTAHALKRVNQRFPEFRWGVLNEDMRQYATSIWKHPKTGAMHIRGKLGVYVISDTLHVITLWYPYTKYRKPTGYFAEFTCLTKPESKAIWRQAQVYNYEANFKQSQNYTNNPFASLSDMFV